jgi:hypothetical protein
LTGAGVVPSNKRDLFAVTRNDLRRRRRNYVEKDHLPGIAADGVGPDADGSMGGNAR